MSAPGNPKVWDRPRQAMERAVTSSAEIVSYEATELAFGHDEPLACLYVVIDGRRDAGVGRFLSTCHAQCDATRLDWQTVRRPRSALVGIELAHTCGSPDLEARSLRLVFDVRRDADALARLITAEVLVLGTRPYGTFANATAAYGIDGDALREATDAASSALTAVAVAVAVAG